MTIYIYIYTCNSSIYLSIYLSIINLSIHLFHATRRGGRDDGDIVRYESIISAEATPFRVKLCYFLSNRVEHGEIAPQSKWTSFEAMLKTQFLFRLSIRNALYRLVTRQSAQYIRAKPAYSHSLCEDPAYISLSLYIYRDIIYIYIYIYIHTHIYISSC